MRSLTLSRGEKLSPSPPHSLNVPRTRSKPIVKSTGRRCAERKAERGGSWRRCDFLISTFRPGPLSSFSLRSVPPPLSYASLIPERMNEPSLRDLGDFSATVNGRGVVALGPCKEKGQPAGFHVLSAPANGATQVCHCRAQA